MNGSYTTLTDVTRPDPGKALQFLEGSTVYRDYNRGGWLAVLRIGGSAWNPSLFAGRRACNPGFD